MNQYSRPARPAPCGIFVFPHLPFSKFFPVIIYFGINPLGITVTGFDPRRCRVFTLCKTAVSSENLKNIHSVSPASVFKRIIGRVERGSFTFIVQKRAYTLINRMANSVLTLFKLHLRVLTLLNYSLNFYTIHLCQFYTS